MDTLSLADKLAIIETYPCITVMSVFNGEAHILGYYEDNQNEYGPHPMRLVELSGAYMPAKRLHQLAQLGISLAEIESEYTQYPQDGEEDTDEKAMEMYRNDLVGHPAIYESQLKDAPLPDGMYTIIERR